MQAKRKSSKAGTPAGEPTAFVLKALKMAPDGATEGSVYFDTDKCNLRKNGTAASGNTPIK
jgi:hypothetical protein